MPYKKCVKTLLIIAIFLGVSFNSHAQIHAGPKAGLNINYTNFGEFNTYRIGYNAGAFGRYDLTDFLYLNAEITYSQMGGGYDSGYYFARPQVFRQNVHVTFHSLAVPLFISMTIPSIAKQR